VNITQENMSEINAFNGLRSAVAYRQAARLADAAGRRWRLFMGCMRVTGRVSANRAKLLDVSGGTRQVKLTLLQENDPEDISQRACAACALRWHATGREVINRSTRGKDLSDFFKGADLRA
jgi:hypothetical protein